MRERKSGILLHITSLPGKYGIGTFGEEAYKFVDLLVETDQAYWQILPLGHTGFGDSPYSSYSAFAGNPLMINLDMLPYEFKGIKKINTKKVDFEAVKQNKLPLIKECLKNIIQTGKQPDNYELFLKENEFWLDDYCFFTALKDHFEQRPFWLFNDGLRLKDEKSIKEYKEKLKDLIEENKLIQYFFFEQWFKLKEYANDRGIKILGDIPLYVAGDSVDVWMNPELFMLNEDLCPVKVAGVPPDYFAETGQLWGNPVYNWKGNKNTGYRWWKERIKMNLKLFDTTRIDHFR